MSCTGVNLGPKLYLALWLTGFLVDRWIPGERGCPLATGAVTGEAENRLK